MIILLLAKRIKFIFQLPSILFSPKLHLISRKNILFQFFIVGPESLGILIISASFIGIIFTLQIIKEFLYLNASSIVGAILSLSFIRELSPVLTAVIITGRISSAFTAELAMMKVTEQIEALYLLRIDPLLYLVWPRLLACLIMLPCLNIFFFLTSLLSSLFICSVFYSIYPYTFLSSVFATLSLLDVVKSCCKACVFGLVISIVSCSFGLTTEGGARNVGKSTTSSVVISLLIIFILDSILTYLLFNRVGSVVKSL